MLTPRIRILFFGMPGRAQVLGVTRQSSDPVAFVRPWAEAGDWAAAVQLADDNAQARAVFAAIRGREHLERPRSSASCSLSSATVIDLIRRPRAVSALRN